MITSIYLLVRDSREKCRAMKYIIACEMLIFEERSLVRKSTLICTASEVHRNFLQVLHRYVKPWWGICPPYKGGTKTNAVLQILEILATSKVL